MSFYFPAYSILYFLAGVVALLFCCIIWLRRPSPGAVPFTLFMAAIAGWIIFRNIEFGAVDIADKVIWARFMFAMVCCAAVLWFCFALDYSGYYWWRRPWALVLLFILPAVSLLLLIVSPGQGWDWLTVNPVLDVSGRYILWERKPLFFFGGAYLYILIGIGLVLLWRSILRNRGIYRRQLIILLIGTLLPAIGIIVYAFGFEIGTDIVSNCFLCAGILYTVTIFKFRFLDVIPVARNVLIEHIPDGILVLNSEDCLADINPTARQMLKSKEKTLLGQPLTLIWPELEMLIRKPVAEREGEMVTEFGLYLDISTINLRDKQRKKIGTLVMLRDITERKLTQKKLEGLYEDERRLRSSLQDEIDKRSKYTRALVHELNTPLTSIMASGEILEIEIEEKTLAALVKNIRRASLNL